MRQTPWLAFVLALALALIAGCDDGGGSSTLQASGPPVAFEAYCETYAAQVCASVEPCGCLEAAGGSVDLCEMFVGSECRGEVEDPVNSGARRYDGAAGGNCVAAMKVITADCRLEDADIALYEASCEHVTVGLRVAGEVCDSDDDCVAPLECYGDVCVALPGEGEPCFDQSSCFGDLYCGADVLCHVQKGVGESCAEGDQACLDDLYCDSRGPVCAAMLAQGQDCGHATWACGDGLFCASDSSTCEPYPGAGQSCALSQGECAEPYYCDAAESCQVKVEVGATCEEDAQCGSDSCDSQVCTSCPFL